MGTNTSKEIEALHEALREVGMSPTIKPGETTHTGKLMLDDSYDEVDGQPQHDGEKETEQTGEN